MTTSLRAVTTVMSIAWTTHHQRSHREGAPKPHTIIHTRCTINTVTVKSVHYLCFSTIDASASTHGNMLKMWAIRVGYPYLKSVSKAC